MQIPVLNGNQVDPRAAPNIQQRPLQSQAPQLLGQGISQASGMLQKIKDEEQQNADRAAFMDADRVTDTIANDLSTQAQSKVLKDAIGIGPKVVSEFDKKTSEVEFGLKNERQKYAYRQAVNARRSTLQRQVDNHEGQQREAYYLKSREDYKDQAHVNAVAAYDDPKAIDAEIDKIRAVIDQTPGLDAAQKETELGVRRTGVYLGVIDRYLANDQIGAADAYYKQVKDRINGDKTARVENAITDAKARVATAEKAAAVTARANRVLNLYASDGPEAGAAALATLSKVLPPDVMSDVYSKVQSNLNQTRNQKQEEHADELANVYQSIAAGNAGTDQLAIVDKLWKDNTFTPTERASLIGRIEATHITHAGNQAAALAVKDALNKGLPLDPSNSEHRKALTLAFGEDARETPVGSPAWQGLAVAYATRTRIVPDQATSWVRSAIRSPDPKVAAPAAQFLGSIEANAADAASGFDDHSKAFAGMVNSMIEAGTPAAKAVETARMNVYEQKPAIIAQRTTEYSAIARNSNNALNSFIDRDMDTSWFSAQPAATAALQADFNAQAQKYYLKTGDVQLSQALAWTDLKRVYGVSEVNGVKQVMAAPPERFGVKPKDVRADIESFVTGPRALPEPALPDSKGLTVAGNIKNIFHRPILENADGGYSTTSSMSFEDPKDGLETLIPTVVDGKRLSEDRAKAHYFETGEHFGKFKDWHDADRYAQSLHEVQAQYVAQSGQRTKAHPLPEGSTPEDIILVPDALTMRATANIMDGQPVSPTYKLINGKTGDLLLDERGIPVRYALPTGEQFGEKIQADRAAATEVARKQVEQARFDRDTRRRRVEVMELR